MSSDNRSSEDTYLLPDETAPERPDEGPAEQGLPPATCGECGGVIQQDDLVCPHCGISLVAG